MKKLITPKYSQTFKVASAPKLTKTTTKAVKLTPASAARISKQANRIMGGK